MGKDGHTEFMVTGGVIRFVLYVLLLDSHKKTSVALANL